MSRPLSAPVGALGGWIVWSGSRGKGLTKGLRDSLDAPMPIDTIPTVL
jgi:hypothetical protein